MQPEPGIAHELSLGEVFSTAFDVFRQHFLVYFALFATVGAVSSVVTVLVQQALVLPTLPTSPTTFSQVWAYLSAFIHVEAERLAITGTVSLVFGALALGTTVKMVSDDIQTGQTNLGGSLRFMLSKLIWLVILQIIVNLIVALGLVALIVPGIILDIMLTLAVPALLLGNAGIIASLGKSRELVGHRWGKTFILLIVIGIIVAIATFLAGVVAGLFGFASPVISGILSGVYQPISPIALVVYYYSNLARLALPPPSPGWATPPAQAPATSTADPVQATKFCPKCGTGMVSSATFCPRCGAQQPS